MINIGYQQYVERDKVLVITQAGAKPLVKLRQNLRDADRLIDCTSGRKIRSLIFVQGDYVIASALDPTTLRDRMDMPEWEKGKAV